MIVYVEFIKKLIAFSLFIARFFFRNKRQEGTGVKNWKFQENVLFE